MKNDSRGFIGILALLIGLAIMAYLMVQSLGVQTKESGGDEVNTYDSNSIPRGFEAINQAKDAKAKIEARNQIPE